VLVNVRVQCEHCYYIGNMPLSGCAHTRPHLISFRLCAPFILCDEHVAGCCWESLINLAAWLPASSSTHQLLYQGANSVSFKTRHWNTTIRSWLMGSRRCDNNAASLHVPAEKKMKKKKETTRKLNKQKNKPTLDFFFHFFFLFHFVSNR